MALPTAWLGLDGKGPVDRAGLLVVIVIGFAMSLAAITALGPLFVFLFQVVEGRVA